MKAVANPPAAASPRAAAPVAPFPASTPNHAPKSTPSPSTGLFIDRVRVRAHEIYVARLASGRPGDAASDWIQAEQELRTRDSALASEVDARARLRGETLLANPT